MNDSNRLEQLQAALAKEIAGAKAGSDYGQFPILDLLGNLRDETAQRPECEGLRAAGALAWERLVTIVESGRGFEPAEVQWLQELAVRLGPGSAPGPAASVAPPAAQAAPEPAGAAPLPTPDTNAAGPAAPPAPAQPAAAPAEETTFMLNLEDGDLLREYIIEAREHLDNIEQGVLVLEHRPDDAEQLNTIFRAFHTFKGSAGALNLMPVSRLAHGLESLLDLARQGRLAIDAGVIDLILGGRDVLKQVIDEMEAQLSGEKPAAPIPVLAAALKTAVMALVESVNSGATAPAPARAAEPEPDMASLADAAAWRLPGQEPAAEKSAPATPPPATAEGEAASAKRTERGAVVKVDTLKLDALLDLVGEMVIAQSLVTQDLNGMAGLHPQFARNLAQLSRTTRELQRVSMAMRMVPIRGAFQKMARVVRDVGVKQQKQVQLATSGEDTELDRNVVEELNDPMLHMIRNAIDHGLESPEVRAARGKPPIGTIHLKASHQGGNIVLEIADDGAGLNRDRILAKAIERGLASPGAELSDEDVFSFIFAAGFSTAEKVTDLSGRGVGMDVVRRNVESLRGRIDISSIPGQGTSFKIALPLTLAIIDGLIVKVGAERYIIPTLSVRESFRPRADMITRVQGAAEVVNVRGRLIPLLRLYDYLGLAPASTDPTQGIVIVAQSGTSLRCLLVDSLLHKQEVVIKNLNELMVHKNRALAGAAILGDGRVGLILDVNILVRPEAQSFSKAA